MTLTFDPKAVVQSAMQSGVITLKPKSHGGRPLAPEGDAHLQRTRAYHRNYKRAWRRRQKKKTRNSPCNAP